jgi:hypothetical protein
MKVVAMFGPSISDPSKMVNRDVPECDVRAYKAVGYQLGSLPDEKPVEVAEATGEVEPKKKRK